MVFELGVYLCFFQHRTQGCISAVKSLGDLDSKRKFIHFKFQSITFEVFVRKTEILVQSYINRNYIAVQELNFEG